MLGRPSKSTRRSMVASRQCRAHASCCLAVVIAYTAPLLLLFLYTRYTTTFIQPLLLLPLVLLLSVLLLLCLLFPQLPPLFQLYYHPTHQHHFFYSYRFVHNLTKTKSPAHNPAPGCPGASPLLAQTQLADLHRQHVQSSAGSPAHPVMWKTIDRWLETATKLDVSQAFPLDKVR